MNKIQEIPNFLSFILKQYEESVLTEGIKKLSAEGKSFEFLINEEDL